VSYCRSPVARPFEVPLSDTGGSESLTAGVGYSVMGSGGELPSGTVTFLFTDIEGSTKLWEQFGEVMGVALALHDELLRAAIDAHGGVVFATGGDGVAAAFRRSGDAVAAAIDAQRALQATI
jgi:class 3 adenylate cyclase